MLAALLATESLGVGWPTHRFQITLSITCIASCSRKVQLSFARKKRVPGRALGALQRPSAGASRYT